MVLSLIGSFISYAYQASSSILFLLLSVMLAKRMCCSRKKDVVKVKRSFDKEYEDKHNVKLIKIVNNRKKKSYVSSLFINDDSEGMISMKTANRMISEFRSMPEDKDVHIMIHTLGGDLNAAEIIARLIHHHKGNVTAIIPNYAYSGGTIISLACDKIVTSTTSVFGPVDPQLIFPAKSIIEAVKQYGKMSIEHIFRIESEKAVGDVKQLLTEVIRFKESDEEKRLEKINNIIDDLVDGKMLHGHPIFSSRLRSYGLNVEDDNERMNDLCTELQLVN